jgi:hypothetical protein
MEHVDELIKVLSHIKQQIFLCKSRFWQIFFCHLAGVLGADQVRYRPLGCFVRVYVFLLLLPLAADDKQLVCHLKTEVDSF